MELHQFVMRLTWDPELHALQTIKRWKVRVSALDYAEHKQEISSWVDALTQVNYEYTLVDGQLQVNREGNLTPMHFAVKQNYQALVSYMLENLEAAPLLNCQEPDHLNTPLMHAMVCGHFDMAKLLILKGASITQPNSEGDTPLLRAIKTQNLSLLRSMKECTVSYGSTWDEVYDRSDSLILCAVKSGGASFMAQYMWQMLNNNEEDGTDSCSASQIIHANQIIQKMEQILPLAQMKKAEGKCILEIVLDMCPRTMCLCEHQLLKAYEVAWQNGDTDTIEALLRRERAAGNETMAMVSSGGCYGLAGPSHAGIMDPQDMKAYGTPKSM